MKKNAVCWNITSRCNENCKFCYRIMCNKENTYEQNKKILDILIKLKTNKISWTGGECLLYPYLFDLMKEANKNNIKNNIITNGRCLTPQIIDKIEKYTDYITFSIDAVNDNINKSLGRGIGHVNHIVKLLEYINKANKNIKVKLNSIVTKKNLESVKEVFEIVEKYPIQRWKLFKFISLRGKSIINQCEFEISDEQYNKFIKEIRKEKMNCPIIECKEEDIEDNYLLINAIGDFIITKDKTDKIICNIKDVNLTKLEEI